MFTLTSLYFSGLSWGVWSNSSMIRNPRTAVWFFYFLIIWGLTLLCGVLGNLLGDVDALSFTCFPKFMGSNRTTFKIIDFTFGTIIIQADIDQVKIPFTLGLQMWKWNKENSMPMHKKWNILCPIIVLKIITFQGPY